MRRGERSRAKEITKLEMSLVDYASSSSSSSSSSDSEDECDEIEEDKEEGHSVNLLHQHHNQQPPLPPPPQPSPAPIDHLGRNTVASNVQQSTLITSAQSSSIERLPDASVLLGSPSFSADLFNTNNHSSRVAAAMAENVSRKREANGSAEFHSRSKVPRGNLPPSRSVPDTLDGALVPPQLRGRSNVVTEDMSNLFVRRHAQSSQ